MKEEEYWKVHSDGHSDGIHTSRYIDHQELRYSLRSVFKHAPWFHRIFIITNGQIPNWLDVRHPKIRIIKHSDIMPADSLPTFNSEAIEANLHNIPELSELFVYANDDYLIYNHVTPSFFFTTDGLPYVAPGKSFLRMRKNLYYWNVRYTSRLIQSRFNRTIWREIAHNMRGYKKSVFTECMNTFPDEVNKVTYSKFRVNDSMQISVVSFYALVKQKAVFSPLRGRQQVVIRIYSPLVTSLLIIAYTLINLSIPRLLCINDGPLVIDANRNTFQAYLQGLYPKPAPWEID